LGVVRVLGKASAWERGGEGVVIPVGGQRPAGFCASLSVRFSGCDDAYMCKMGCLLDAAMPQRLFQLGWIIERQAGRYSPLAPSTLRMGR
jgi:hypothetical protein